MSVLIRGLSKPENCFSCPFFDVYSPSRSSGDEDYQCDLFVSLDYWQAAGKADKACPLVEINDEKIVKVATLEDVRNAVDWAVGEIKGGMDWVETNDLKGYPLKEIIALAESEGK